LVFVFGRRKVFLFQIDVQTGQAFDNFGKFEIIEDALW
jgi:hypothetical protein